MTGKPFGHLGEDSVTDTVPKRVVYDLEAVKIEVKHCKNACGPVETAKALGQSVKQHCPVGKAGQRICQRLTFEVDRADLPIGDITHDRYDQYRAAVIDPPRCCLCPTSRPVAAQEPVIRRDEGRVGQLDARSVYQGEIVGMNELVLVVTF